MQAKNGLTKEKFKNNYYNYPQMSCLILSSILFLSDFLQYPCANNNYPQQNTCKKQVNI